MGIYGGSRRDTPPLTFRESLPYYFLKRKDTLWTDSSPETGVKVGR